MKLSVVHPENMAAESDSLDHSVAMRADPGRYGFTPAELMVLTPEEMRIGMTKQFLQARADVRLHQAQKKQLPGAPSPVG